MIKHTVIIPLFVLAEISQVVTASQETPNIDPAAPISKYSLEVQEAAQQFMDKSWFVERRLKKVRNRLQRWQELAEDCDDLSDPVGVAFYTLACKNYARSTRGENMPAYRNYCTTLNDWYSERKSTLREKLEEGKNRDANITLATNAAIDQLEFEIESICAVWISGRLSLEYQHLINLEITGNRPVHEFVVQWRTDHPGVYMRGGRRYDGSDAEYSRFSGVTNTLPPPPAKQN